MKLNTENEGLGSIWKPYEIKAVEILLSHEERQSTGEVWNKILESGIKISRASVIFFLNRLVNEGLADFIEKTGKGGYHKLYRLIADDRTELGSVLVDRFLYKLWEIFPENNRLAELIKT